jgi:hypothetical protein
MKRQFRQAYVEPTSEQDELLRWKRAHWEEAQIQSRMGKRGPPPSKRPACGCVNPSDVEKARLVWQEARIPSGARWARNTKRYSRLVTLGERLETIRTDMRELGVLDDLKKIERRHAVCEGSWRRVWQREAVLSQVEGLKLATAQFSTLSESAIDALADNSTDLDVRDWLSRAPDICAIAERTETALLEKRRRAPSPRVQQWLIAELAGFTRKPIAPTSQPAAEEAPALSSSKRASNILNSARWSANSAGSIETAAPRKICTSTHPSFRARQSRRN